MDVFEGIVLLVSVDTKMFDFAEWDAVTGVPPKEVIAEQEECAGVKALDMYNRVQAFTSPADTV